MYISSLTHKKNDLVIRPDDQKMNKIKQKSTEINNNLFVE